MFKVAFILFYLTSCLNVFAQRVNRYGQADTTKIFAINHFKYHVDSTAVKKDSLMLDFDSIDVDVKYFDNKTETTSFFRKSNSVLRIDFYFDNCKLSLADVKERSPRFDDLYAASIFYFQDDSIFYSDYHFKVRPCMGIPLDKSFFDLYGYNPNLNGDLLKRYVRELYSKIKNCSQHWVWRYGG